MRGFDHTIRNFFLLMPVTEPSVNAIVTVRGLRNVGMYHSSHFNVDHEADDHFI